MADSPEVEAAAEELLQQMAVMPFDELHDFFFNRLAWINTLPEPDQVEPRRELLEFLNGRNAALRAAIKKLERAEAES